ncbi:sulfite exporter TauE/SafE family protein [Candidatus Puniceispirillum sp.]|uniref:sulfite exporter TauE/SafE family protein n=1 Tax=Candidatus Puniceispirillum sp. TaxID=2026719 RepID=UPI003F6968B8
MISSFYLFLALGAACGGFVNGLAGFGTAIFALGFWLHIMPPMQAVAITLAVSITTGAQGVWVVRKAIRANPRRLLWFLLPGICGVPIGVASLSYLDASILKLVIGMISIVYGLFFLAQRSLPRVTRSMPAADALIGFISGIFGGAASLSGALMMMWNAVRDWQKAEIRAVLQPFNFVVLSCGTAMMAMNGAYDIQTLSYLALAIPVALLSAQAGIALFRRMQSDAFRRLLIVMMLISGCVLVIRNIV